ncbi:MAG: glycoside hydrolase [Muribaculaceae bacterium]|nr:glycoside hydrolase [Muribaculaceae bacterium]
MNIKSITITSLLLITSIHYNNMKATGPVDSIDQPVERSLVFHPGEYDSRFYRIPAIVVAKNGDIVAVADKRIDSQRDLPGKIDIVCRRSSDGGKTWSPYSTVIAHDSIGGFGDPALVVDRKSGDILCISTHGNGLWQKTPGHIMVSRSTDNGLTWLPPVEISDQLYNAPGAPIQNVSGAFASSGGALSTSSGRLMFVLVVRKAGEPRNAPFQCRAIFSDDSGHTWHVSPLWPATDSGDESKVVELADGSLIMSIRNRHSGHRLFSRSFDGGITWSSASEVSDLIDPACNGDILLYNRDGHDLLLQSLPGSPKKRVDVTVYASKDNGATWPAARKITSGPTSYSAMTVLPDGSIGMLTEEDTDLPGKPIAIWFNKIPLNHILSGNDKPSQTSVNK